MAAQPGWSDTRREIAKNAHERKRDDPEYQKQLADLGRVLHTFHKDDFPERVGERSLKMFADDEFKERWRENYDLSRPVANKNISAANKRNWENPEFRERHTERLRKALDHPEIRLKRSVSIRRAYAEGRIVQFKSNGYIVTGRTNLERAVELPLFLSGVPYLRNLRVWRYYIDFAIPEVMVGIEADGLYWHSGTERVERDRKRDEYLTSRGWTIIRLTEAEIKDDVIKALSEKVFPILERAFIDLSSSDCD